MESLIVFIVVLTAGYVGTNFIFNKIQSRYYVPSGIEYIFLGIIISPTFAGWFHSVFNVNYPDILSPEIMHQIFPGLAAAIGFIGFSYGLNFNFKNINGSEPEHWRLALFEILISFIVIGGISFIALSVYYEKKITYEDIFAASFTLSIIGALSSNFIIKSLIQKDKVSGSIGESLLRSSLINSNLNIFIYGLLFAFVRKGTQAAIAVTAVEWIVIGIMLAVLIGFLFFIFIGREKDENKMFVAVIGIIIFTSGISYYLNFSPLYMNFVLGMMLSNLSKIAEQLEKSLKRLLQPMSVLVVVMAGFLWVPVGYAEFGIGVAAFLLLRWITKSAAGAAAYYTAYSKEKLTPAIGNGLMSLDIVACAMIIDYVNVFDNALTPIVISTSLISLIVFNVIGYSMAKNLLVDMGEITEETK